MINPVKNYSNKIKIAVSGHRDVLDSKELRKFMEDVILLIQRKYPSENFRIFSCMAEGADLILTDELITGLRADLVAVLPLSIEEHEKDFISGSNLRIFTRQIRNAYEIILPAHQTHRPQCYYAANQIMMSKVDSLVVVWDGMPSRGLGGTASVVELARARMLPIAWIRLKKGVPVELRIENYEGTFKGG